MFLLFAVVQLKVKNTISKLLSREIEYESVI